jgi:hypothetical protein
VYYTDLDVQIILGRLGIRLIMCIFQGDC